MIAANTFIGDTRKFTVKLI